MLFDWTTFSFEIINFLILVWILKRLFYRPVLESIARRQAAVEKIMNDARALETQANAAKVRYEQRLEEWEHERAAARSQLVTEMQIEEEKLRERLKRSLEAEKEKVRALEVQQLEEQRCLTETTALEQAAFFITRLLKRLASPELEARIVDVAIQDIKTLSEVHRASLIAALQESAAPIRVLTAYECPESMKARLALALAEVLGQNPPITWHVDAHLTAGIHLEVGAWVLKAALEDESAFFRQTALSVG